MGGVTGLEEVDGHGCEGHVSPPSPTLVGLIAASEEPSFGVTPPAFFIEPEPAAPTVIEAEAPPSSPQPPAAAALDDESSVQPPVIATGVVQPCHHWSLHLSHLNPNRPCCSRPSSWTRGRYLWPSKPNPQPKLNQAPRRRRHHRPVPLRCLVRLK